MGIRIELNPETEARLAAEAQARGMALEAYAGSLLQQAVASPQGSSPRLTPEQFREMLVELASGSEHLPQIPSESFSRESFYPDRS